MAWKPDYATAADFKSYVGVDALDLEDDTEIALALTTASRAVDNFTKRQFGSAAGARLYTPEWSTSYCRWKVETDDFQSTAGGTLTVDGESVALADCLPKPLNAAANGWAYTMLLLPEGAAPTGDEGSAALTLTFGWSAVPVAVKQATLLQALRFFKRKDSPYGVAGSPEMGSEMRLLAKADPDVCVMLREYQRIWFSA